MKKVTIFTALCASTTLWSNPNGGTAVSGTVDLQTSGSVLTIQASDRSVIHWQDFSIGLGETTEFVQPSANAVVLNRVTSDTPSSILGNLVANGKVYLMNPNGIFFGQAGVINTGGFIATTLDQGQSKFFENGELELRGDSEATIVNLGNITSTGDIFLVGKEINNQGSILSNNGIVGFAAGQDVLLKESGDQRIFIRPVGEGEVQNSGTVEALSIEIRSRGNPYSLAINLEGHLQVNQVAESGGRIFLKADRGDINIAPIEETFNPNVDITIETGTNGNINVATVDGTHNNNPVEITANPGEILAGSGSGGLVVSGDVDVVTVGDVLTVGNSGVVTTPVITGNIPVAGSIDLTAQITPNLAISVQGDVTLSASGNINITTNNSGQAIVYDDFDVGLSGDPITLNPGNASVLNRVIGDTNGVTLNGSLNSNSGSLTISSGISVSTSTATLTNGSVDVVNVSGQDDSNQAQGSQLTYVFASIPTVQLITTSVGPSFSSINNQSFTGIKTGEATSSPAKNPILSNQPKKRILSKFDSRSGRGAEGIINLNR